MVSKKNISFCICNQLCGMTWLWKGHGLNTASSTKRKMKRRMFLDLKSHTVGLQYDSLLLCPIINSHSEFEKISPLYIEPLAVQRTFLPLEYPQTFSLTNLVLQKSGLS